MVSDYAAYERRPATSSSTRPAATRVLTDSGYGRTGTRRTVATPAVRRPATVTASPSSRSRTRSRPIEGANRGSVWNPFPAIWDATTGAAGQAWDATTWAAGQAWDATTEAATNILSPGPTFLSPGATLGGMVYNWVGGESGQPDHGGIPPDQVFGMPPSESAEPGFEEWLAMVIAYVISMMEGS